MVLETVPHLYALRRGAFAGLLGSVLLGAYRLGIAYFSVGVLREEPYRYVASGLIGDGAYVLPGGAWLGVALALLLGMAWGAGFAIAALQAPGVVRRPILSGAFFGLVVYTMMRVVTLGAATSRPATPSGPYLDLIACIIFFGIPVALVVSARRRAT